MRPLPAFVLVAACGCAAHRHPPSPANEASPTAELQRSADVEIHRDDPRAGVTAATAFATDHGGWVESIADQRVLLRLPDAQLDAALDDLARLGEVASRRVQAQEVGDAHRDLRVRIDSLRRTRERYLALLDKAQSVADATAVERELERVTSELERLEATLAAMEKKIAYSSLSLEFSRKVRPGPLGWPFYWAYAGVKWLFVWD